MTDENSFESPEQSNKPNWDDFIVREMANDEALAILIFEREELYVSVVDKGGFHNIDDETKQTDIIAKLTNLHDAIEARKIELGIFSPPSEKEEEPEPDQ